VEKMNMNDIFNFGYLDVSSTYSNPSFIEVHNAVNRTIVSPGYSATDVNIKKENLLVPVRVGKKKSILKRKSK
jgi:hypothetical protein